MNFALTSWEHEIVILITLLRIIHIRNWISETSFCLSKGQIITKTNYGFLNSPQKRTKLTILSKEDAQDSEVCSFLGRIEKTINWFRDLLFLGPERSQMHSVNELILKT